MQKKNTALPLLIELAKARSDKARKIAQLLSHNAHQAQRQLIALQDYLRDYEDRLGRSSQAGMTPEEHQNYRLFLAKLELAIQQQSNEVSQLSQRKDSAQQHWQAEERRTQSFSTLQARQAAQAAAREAAQLQKLLDEFATQAAARTTTSGYPST